MRLERLYLEDIVEAADAIQRFVAGVERGRFASDELVRSAVLHKLQVIGEAAAHLSVETRARIPNVPWREVVAFRNFTVHTYFAVDWDIVWVAAVRDAPAIGLRIQEVLTAGL